MLNFNLHKHLSRATSVVANDLMVALKTKCLLSDGKSLPLGFVSL